ncbi:putative reverse transcriptase domain-containing protein [Tanacetum coccineum]
MSQQNTLRNTKRYHNSPFVAPKQHNVGGSSSQPYKNRPSSPIHPFGGENAVIIIPSHAGILQWAKLRTTTRLGKNVKVVRIPLEGGEILRVQGERTLGGTKTLMSTKADEPELSDIPIVRDFTEFGVGAVKKERLSCMLVFQVRVLAAGIGRTFPRHCPSASVINVSRGPTKNKNYEWARGSKEERPFQTLKDNLCNAPILSLPDGIKDFVVFCDASNQGLGYVLMQEARCLKGGGLSYSVTMSVRFATIKIDSMGFVNVGRLLSSERDFIMNSIWHFGQSVYVKAEHQRPSGLLQQPEIPEWKWDNITMDFYNIEAQSGERERSIKIEYADNRRKSLEFKVGDQVLLKVSPWKCVIRFGKKGKLAPRYVGQFEILERIGPVAYQLRLPEELSSMHDTFSGSDEYAYSVLVMVPGMDRRDTPILYLRGTFWVSILRKVKLRSLASETVGLHAEFIS